MRISTTCVKNEWFYHLHSLYIQMFPLSLMLPSRLWPITFGIAPIPEVKGDADERQTAPSFGFFLYIFPSLGRRGCLWWIVPDCGRRVCRRVAVANCALMTLFTAHRPAREGEGGGGAEMHYGYFDGGALSGRLRGNRPRKQLNAFPFFPTRGAKRGWIELNWSHNIWGVMQRGWWWLFCFF